MTQAETILREYIKFTDVNGNKSVSILPLTIIDMMEEYADHKVNGFVLNLAASIDEFFIINNEISLTYTEEDIKNMISDCIKKYFSDNSTNNL